MVRHLAVLSRSVARGALFLSRASGATATETTLEAGVFSANLHLKIGGEAWGCDSRSASSLEFDPGACTDGSTSCSDLKAHYR